MIGIKSIGSYIPKEKISNVGKTYGDIVIEDSYIDSRIGFKECSRVPKEINASDLCIKAMEQLTSQTRVTPEEIECICVCTQNGDYRIPHTSAIVHNALGLNEGCAFFDISLGCSGYIYALNVMKSFMESNEYKCGVLFTADPYSKIIDTSDKNTDLLFGDAATATLLTDEPVFDIGKFAYGSDTSEYKSLIKREEDYLFMNGSTIFEFAVRKVPTIICKCLQINNDITIDKVVFHQASKYVIESLIKRIKGTFSEKCVIEWDENTCGNTASSSIPIILQKEIKETSRKNYLIIGFGVGLSIASTVLIRR